MIRQFVVGSLVLLASATQLHANGRPAATSTINFRQGNEQHIAAGMTFGLLVSKDGGATWRWFCEDAIKYGGMYDPDYAYTPTGALFATTFDRSLVNRDGCSFDATPFGKKFMSAIALGPRGHVFTGTVHPRIRPRRTPTIRRSTRAPTAARRSRSARRVAGGRNTGLFVSRTPSNGDAWVALPGAPHVNCLVENTAGKSGHAPRTSVRRR